MSGSLSLALALPSSPLFAGVGGLQSLFANGENGFLFDDMSDLTRLFTTSMGPTVVAANDDPVGLLLDRSKWGGRTLTALLASQSEQSVNGGFDTNTDGWSAFNSTLASVGGELEVTGAGGNFPQAFQAVTTIPGVTYRFAVTARRGTTLSNASLTASDSGGTIQSASTAAATPTLIEFYFVARQITTNLVMLISSAAGSGTAYFDNLTFKSVPGNHAVAAAGLSSQRPFWKSGSKPYLAPDGTDDRVVTPFIPSAALTLALACRFPATDATGRIMLGGGTSTGNKRAFIGKNSTDGKVIAGWGAETIGSGWGADLGIADHAIVLTGDAVTRDIWVDGVLIDSRAPTGGPDGTGGGIALGAYNNNGSPSSFSGGRLPAALGLNRRVTPAEIARITTQFQQRF